MMGKVKPLSPAVTLLLLASTLVCTTEGFAPPIVVAVFRTNTIPPPAATSVAHDIRDVDYRQLRSYSRGGYYGTNAFAPRPATTRGHHHHSLRMMSNNDNDEGPGIVTAVFISGVLLFFVASAFAPLLDYASITPSPSDLSLGDSVVTRSSGGDGASTAGAGSKLKNYQSKFDALSTTRIQEKLSNLPVFYSSTTSSDDGTRATMAGDKVFLSYDDAEESASKLSQSSPSSVAVVVKATTLDQVMYPLILKRQGASGAMANKSLTGVTTTPAEIKNAQKLAMADDGNNVAYTLVPSRAALNDANGMSLRSRMDIPLFVVDRLAFASDDGKPRVPLFTERGEASASYARLRESSSGGRLQEEPTIRTTSLLDVLESMEGGTRPGVGQIEFYGNAKDALKADEMMMMSPR